MESRDSEWDDILTVLKHMLSTKILYPEKIIKQIFLDLKKNEKYTARKSALAKKQSKITKKGITVMHMKFCLTQKKALMEK